MTGLDQIELVELFFENLLPELLLVYQLDHLEENSMRNLMLGLNLLENQVSPIRRQYQTARLVGGKLLSHVNTIACTPDYNTYQTVHLTNHTD